MKQLNIAVGENNKINGCNDIFQFFLNTICRKKNKLLSFSKYKYKTLFHPPNLTTI